MKLRVLVLLSACLGFALLATERAQAQVPDKRESVPQTSFGRRAREAAYQASLQHALLHIYGEQKTQTELLRQIAGNAQIQTVMVAQQAEAFRNLPSTLPRDPNLIRQVPDFGPDNPNAVPKQPSTLHPNPGSLPQLPDNGPNLTSRQIARQTTQQGRYFYTYQRK